MLIYNNAGEDDKYKQVQVQTSTLTHLCFSYPYQDYYQGGFKSSKKQIQIHGYPSFARWAGAEMRKVVILYLSQSNIITRALFSVRQIMSNANKANKGPGLQRRKRITVTKILYF